MTQFASYTRSTAFSLTMSSESIAELLDLEVLSHTTTYPDPPYAIWCKPEYGVAIERRGVVAYLQRRGLIIPATAPSCDSNWMLSDAGKLLCPLLRAAGFCARFRLVVEDSGRRYVERV